MRKMAVIAMFCVVAGSCRKKVQCECSNSNGTYLAGEINDTASKAKKQCESLSTADTRCYIK
jgi:hypothetical protein